VTTLLRVVNSRVDDTDRWIGESTFVSFVLAVEQANDETCFTIHSPF
jgi:hypothetical protein